MTLPFTTTVDYYSYGHPFHHQRRHSGEPEAILYYKSNTSLGGSNCCSPNNITSKGTTFTYPSETLCPSGSFPSAKCLTTINPNPHLYGNSHTIQRNTGKKFHPLYFSSSSASGTNPTLVAIDHKIEQAMDLVKTHLMFAVREEVDTLRTRIKELEATATRLERENNFLKEHIPTNILTKVESQFASTSLSTHQ
uniref:TSC22 domain family protein 1-like n=1 Tax=Parastrongyloides trichosuri TaxID=131310 RepID=A0A0N4ZK73_PARTI